MFGGGILPGNSAGKVFPITDLEDMEAHNMQVEVSRRGSFLEKQMAPKQEVDDETGELGRFKALPSWVTRRVHPNVVALAAFLLLAMACIIVACLSIIQSVQTGTW